MWQDFHDEIQELIDTGDHVVSVVTTRGRGRASGVDVEWRGNAGVWTIHDGRVIRVVWFPNREEAFEAAGLRA
jgi:ketosteroid isomerase-like protein